MKKRDVKIFLRSAVMTAVVLCCIAAVFFGMCEVYEEIKRLSFTEDISAVYICRDYIRIFDFKIEFGFKCFAYS